jgi:hypothetical protein
MPSHKDDPVYTKNEREKPTRVMTQSGKHCRVAAFEREEVEVGEDVDDGDVGLELGPEDVGRDD